MVIAFAGSILANSLALLTEAVHMLSHVGTLTVTFIAISLATRPPTAEKSFGYYRLEVLAALADGTVLIIMVVYIFFQGYLRLLTPPDVGGSLMTTIAIVGFALNLIGAKLVIVPSKGSLVFRGIFLEVLVHALSTLGVIIAGAIIIITGWNVADPVVSMLVGVIMLPGIYKLIKGSVNVLIESSPTEISPYEVEGALMRIQGVRGVHDLHVWTITSGINAASVHITTDSPEEWETIQEQARKVLRENFKMAHATIQVENERTHRLHTEGTA